MMRGLVPAAKLLAGNLALVALLLLLLNGLSFVAIHLRQKPIAPVDRGTGMASIWQRPTFSDPQRARLIFQEFAALQSRYEPFIGWTRLEFQGETTHIDASGDRVHPAPPYSGPRRSARFFGGSTMWGTGVEDVGTIPAIFNRLNPGYDVRNHGETAFTSRQGLDRLIDLVALGESIDLVVFFDGVNDAVQQCRSEMPVPGHSRVGQIRQALERLPEEPSVTRSLGHVLEVVFVRYSVQMGRAVLRRLPGRPAQTPTGAARPDGGYDCDDAPEKALRVAEALLHTWQIAHDIVTAQGGTFLAILQPHAFAGSPRVDHLVGYLDPQQGASLLVVYHRVQQRLREDPRPWIVDWTDAYDRERTGDQMILFDEFHVIEPGNEIIARRIDARLREAAP